MGRQERCGSRDGEARDEALIGEPAGLGPRIGEHPLDRRHRQARVRDAVTANRRMGYFGVAITIIGR